MRVHTITQADFDRAMELLGVQPAGDTMALTKLVIENGVVQATYGRAAVVEGARRA